MPDGHCIFGIAFTVSCSAIRAIGWGQKGTKMHPDFWYLRSWKVVNFYLDIWVGSNTLYKNGQILSYFCYRKQNKFRSASNPVLIYTCYNDRCRPCHIRLVTSVQIPIWPSYCCCHWSIQSCLLRGLSRVVND